jgi:hypothetical protein
LTQTARNSANAPLVMHWRKWTVKFKVGEREFYYGLLIDLDEAERVCAAAWLEHEPKASARDDSTAHLGAKSSRSKKLDADPPQVQMVLSYRLAATFGGDPV